MAEYLPIQVLVALVLVLPLVATVGQLASSGFLAQTARIEILFWPGAEWQWAPRLSVLPVTALFALAYVSGVGVLMHRRTLATVVVLGAGAAVLANLLGGAINHLTGWKELQAMGTLELAGRVNQAILAMWHNPIWEEVAFRGLPLLVYAAAARRWPRTASPGRWCYVLLPSLLFAAYHVPRHGYSRIADTLVLGVVFALLAPRHTFFAPLVLHCIFDAMAVIGLPQMKNVPAGEVRWLAEHAGILNTLQSLALLAIVALALVALVRHLRSTRCAAATRTPTAGE